MRKLIFKIVFTLIPTFFFGQTVFDKYDGQEEVTSVIVNKKMFQLMGSVKMDLKDKEAQQYLDLIKKLDNLKVFTTESQKTTADMKATTEKYIKSAGLEELMRVNEAGKSIKILVKSGSKDTQIKELLMFIESANKSTETVLMSLTGDFDLSEIAILTDKMKIPGGEVLKKAAKKQ